jgi:uncharacterized protein (TIGR03435 family)
MRGSAKNMRQHTGKFVLSLAVITTAPIPLLSQTLPTQKPSFEVVSVKLNRSGQDGGSIRPSGDRLIATNVTLKNLLNFAFRPSKGQFLNQQIIGGPAWIDTDRFDVQAKLEGGGPSLPPEQLRDMLQALLEDRFQLKARRDSRELPIYNLVVTKGGGPKLSQDQTPPDPRQGFIRFISAGEHQQSDPLPRGAVRVVRGPSSSTLSATAIPISLLVNLLQGQSDRIVIDKTNVKGLFDVNLHFTNARFIDSTAAPTPGLETPSDPFGPSLFTAIQELGLKLESGKSPLEVLVIDSVQKPSEN